MIKTEQYSSFIYIGAPPSLPLEVRIALVPTRMPQPRLPESHEIGAELMLCPGHVQQFLVETQM